MGCEIDDVDCLDSICSGLFSEFEYFPAELVMIHGVKCEVTSIVFFGELRAPIWTDTITTVDCYREESCGLLSSNI